MQRCDTLIRGATVIDGTGAPAVRQRRFFRLRVHDLARLVAFNRLIDSDAAAATPAKRSADPKRIWKLWKKA